MDKVQEIHNILKERLPEELFFPITIFDTCENMLRSLVGENWNYDYLIEYYSKYKPDNYLKGKYRARVIMKNSIPALNINALATNPIICNAENMGRASGRSDWEIAYILLHEFGHHMNNGAHKFHNEHLADMFAVKWVKVLIDEGWFEYEE